MYLTVSFNIFSTRCPTFPDPEQFGHLSVLGADRGWSPPMTVETGSIRTSDPVLEHRAQARYPALNRLKCEHHN